jgi:hypothetical protein
LKVYDLTTYQQYGSDFDTNVTNATSICIDTNNKLLYVGSGSTNSIKIFDVSTDTPAAYTIPNLYLTGSNINVAYGLNFDRNRNLIIGCTNQSTNNIFFINALDYTSTYINVKYATLKPKILGEYPYCITVDDYSGNLLIGTDANTDKYVYILDIITKFQNDIIDLKLTGVYATTILLHNKNDGSYWLGSADSTTVKKYDRFYV